MRDRVIHPGSGVVLDFGEDDFGGPEQAAVISDWREWHLRRHAKPGEFVCEVHRNRERPWLYLQQRGGLLVAAHWPGTALAGSHEIYHGVSDEHRRQVDYMQRAGEAAGFEVRTEVRLPTKVRPDAVIYGPHVQMGVEVQRSSLAVSAAKARTTKARRAGVEPIWFSDRQSNPPWMWQVPSARMNPAMSWEAVPNPRSVAVVSGVRVIVPRRCRNIRNGRCPRRRYGCNEWHADHEPRLNTLLDDLAEMVPAGRIVPMLYGVIGGDREYVLLVSRNDKTRYEEMVGASADLPLRERERLQATERILCNTDAGIVIELPQVNPQPVPTYTPTTFVQPERIERDYLDLQERYFEALDEWQSPSRQAEATARAARCELHGRFLVQLVPGRLYCPLCHQQQMNQLGLGNYPVGGG